MPKRLQLPPPDENPGFMLTHTRMRLRRALIRLFKAHGYDLSPEYWGVMNMIASTESAHQTALAERLGKEKPNLSRLLDGLEQHGYLRREPDPADRRSHRPVLTPAGEQVLAELTPLVAGFLHEIFGPVDRKDFATFLRVLHEVGDRLDGFLHDTPHGEG